MLLRQSGTSFGEGSDTLYAELAQKQMEIEMLKQKMVDMQQREINDAFGLEQDNPESSSDLLQLQHDYEELMIKYQELEARSGQMVTPQKLEERDAFWQAEIEHVRASQADGLDQQSASEAEQLKSEIEQVQTHCNQLTSENEEMLKQRQKLDEEITQLQHALQERDAVWQQELISSQTDQQEMRKQFEAVKVRLL